MADDKMKPKEVSNIFNSVMKGSAKPIPYDEEKCPTCGEMAKKINQQDKGKSITFTYRCPNDHTFHVKHS